MSTRTRLQKKMFRKKATVPVHPRDHYWYRTGKEYGADKRRKLETSLDKVLPPLTHGGGSYRERYRDMFEAGFKAARS